MEVATARALIEEFRSGGRTSSFIPVPPDRDLSAGDVVTFREANFDGFGIPEFVANGVALSGTLTETWNTEFKWLGFVILGIKWGERGLHWNPSEERDKARGQS
jgi:hypothetical protein